MGGVVKIVVKLWDWIEIFKFELDVWWDDVLIVEMIELLV